MIGSLFGTGIIIGFLIAVPVGPVGVLCAHRTITRGALAGFASGLGAAVAAYFSSESGKQLIAFGRESVREVKKVVWPTRQEAMQMTGYVFAFVVVMALMLWITDKTLEWLLYGVILGWNR